MWAELRASGGVVGSTVGSGASGFAVAGQVGIFIFGAIGAVSGAYLIVREMRKNRDEAADRARQPLLDELAECRRGAEQLQRTSDAWEKRYFDLLEQHRPRPGSDR